MELCVLSEKAIPQHSSSPFARTTFFWYEVSKTLWDRLQDWPGRLFVHRFSPGGVAVVSEVTGELMPVPRTAPDSCHPGISDVDPHGYVIGR